MGSVLGPIPWSKRLDYAVRAGLDPAMIEVFLEVIAEMDAVWLKWTSDEMEKNRPNQSMKKPERAAKKRPARRRRG